MIFFSYFEKDRGCWLLDTANKTTSFSVVNFVCLCVFVLTLSFLCRKMSSDTNKPVAVVEDCNDDDMKSLPSNIAVKSEPNKVNNRL
jgi:hypothetical protein